MAAVQAGHLGVGLIGPSEHGTVIQGPGSKAALVGPDGSHISAAVDGGTVVAPPKAGKSVWFKDFISSYISDILISFA